MVNVTTPYAYLSMEIAQLVDSSEVIRQMNPLEIAEILGNIGGFWGETLSISCIRDAQPRGNVKRTNRGRRCEYHKIRAVEVFG